MNREAKRGRGRGCPAATAAAAGTSRVPPAQAPSTSAPVPPAKPAAAASSCSAAQTERRSPGRCSSGGRPAPALRCACCGGAAGGRYTRHRSRSGASSGGSLSTCWRYLRRTGSGGPPSPCPLNSDPRPRRGSAPEPQLGDGSEQRTRWGGWRRWTFNNNGGSERAGVSVKSTHWMKGKVPVEGWAVLQPVKVKFTVQFTWEANTEHRSYCQTGRSPIRRRHPTTPTVLRVEGVRSLPQGTAAGGAAEALPVEVEPLGAKPFHHVHSLLTRVALVAWRGERPPYRVTLKWHARKGGGKGQKGNDS